MEDAKLRAWRWHRQGLDGALAGGSAAAVLAQSGWARSVGGVGPYLTLFSRGGIDREATDAAVAGLEIHELPSARGCTYVLPAADYALALTVGQGFGDQEMNVARKLGVKDAEIDKLCETVVKVLAGGPLLPQEIRESTGSAVRDLGAEGKKRGLTSTLPIALGRLQSAGEIRRVPVDGRLDQQRYRYARWRPSPLRGWRATREAAFVELARRFFSWIGPASSAEFQAFAGLGVKAARAAIEPLGLVALDPGSELAMFPADRDALKTYRPPKSARYALVSGLDGLFLLRRNLGAVVAPEDGQRTVYAEKGCAVLGGLADLPSHAIVDRGRLVGLWEYDPESASIVWWPFVKPDKALRAEVERTEDFVRSQLQDARSFSLDSPKSRAPRIAALRKACGRGAR